MSRGLTYMMLLASIRQREMLEEAARNRWVADVPRRRRERIFGLSLSRLRRLGR